MFPGDATVYSEERGDAAKDGLKSTRRRKLELETAERNIGRRPFKDYSRGPQLAKKGEIIIILMIIIKLHQYLGKQK